MATRQTNKIPKDFPDTWPDIIKVNGVPIRTDLLQDCLADVGVDHLLFKEILVCLLDPNWGEN